eukprot:COSAG03_NODE_1132_length_4749_cov_2.785806_1_plen_198_part_10
MFEAGRISHLSLDGFLRVLANLHGSSRMGKQVAEMFFVQLEEIHASLEEAFQGFDGASDRVLTRTELVQGLRSIGISISVSDERRLMRLLDTNGAGEIDLYEFAAEFDKTKESICPVISKVQPKQKDALALSDTTPVKLETGVGASPAHGTATSIPHTHGAVGGDELQVSTEDEVDIDVFSEPASTPDESASEATPVK